MSEWDCNCAEQVAELRSRIELLEEALREAEGALTNCIGWLRKGGDRPEAMSAVQRVAERTRAVLASTSAGPLLHEWFVAGDEYPGLSKDYQSCRRCGVVRQANGSTDAKQCRGVVHIRPRPAGPTPEPQAGPTPEREQG